ncbi:fatty acid hydroxylase superfamily-domain-containing protein [Stachybotrys elegans]|uniref:Fatty acid hydroxylase superfamily-domain-containing protein n=1 Tax=Stachybotrys elegans TaxID=80388 RepID=A0A8K0SLP5_9HYPO|nr:fatty acid hydroxylase superfamily-domain-containing protein [Stachybotrys elegans]
MILAIQAVLASAAHTAGKPPVFRVEAKLPAMSEVLRDVTLCILLREVLFYSSHRALHMPSVYRRIHKTHHKFTAPVSFASQYAHPLEHLVSNAAPIAIPAAALHVHVVTLWVFMVWQLLETATTHSGYDFLAGAARKHDRHHERFDVYFGGIGILDWLHGTGEREKRN